MNYYENIKEELINNEVYKKVKDYSKNKNDLKTYYNVGKMLSEAGKHYGESIIKEYSKKLTEDLKVKYTKSSLYNMLNFYYFMSSRNFQTLSGNLNWSHYIELLSIKDDNKVKYYIKITEENNLSVRELRNKIKSNEYERLDNNTKEKLKKEEKLQVQDLVKNPIILKTNKEIIKEKALQQLILEDMENFLVELGSGFSFIKSEYKIKIGSNYNYIDLLLFNYVYNCFIVIELKVTELKKEHIGQIETYMNYIDKNLKTINQEKTIGIIITKKDNKFIMEYCSDKRILNTTYELQGV